MRTKFDSPNQEDCFYLVKKVLNNVKHVTLTFDPLKSYRCHPLVIRSMCTKFDGPSWNSPVCIVLTRFQQFLACDLDLPSLNLKSNRCRPLGGRINLWSE